MMRISTVLLRVADIERSRAFYADTLGLAVGRELPNFLFLQVGEVELGLNQVAAEKAGDRGCLTEVSLEVDDIETTFRELSERGVTFLAEPFHASSEGDRELWVAPFRDPDGHLLSIISWRAAS